MPLTKYPENDKELSRKPLSCASPIVIVTKDGKQRRFHPGHYGYREDTGQAEMLLVESWTEIEVEFHSAVPAGAFDKPKWIRYDQVPGVKNG